MQKRRLAADLLGLLACLLFFSLFSLCGSPIRDISIEDKLAIGSSELYLPAVVQQGVCMIKASDT